VSLRTRLGVVVGTLVVVPLVLGVVLVVVLVSSTATTGVEQRLQTASSGAARALAERCVTLGAAARALASEAAATSPQAAIVAQLERRPGYAALLAADGTAVAEGGALPEGLQPGSVASCADGVAGPVVAGVVPVRAGAELPQVRSAVVAQPLDRDLLEGLRPSGRSDITVLDASGAVVASTAGAGTAAEVALGMADRGSDDRAAFAFDGGLGFASPPAPGGLPWYVAATAEEPTFGDLDTVLLAVVLPVVLLSVVLAVVIARVLTRPLAQLSRAAGRVTEGDLDSTVSVPAGGDLGQLGEYFNQMTGQLRRSQSEVARSNEEARAGLARMGEALQSTLNAEALMQVVLDAAMVSTDSAAGAALVDDGTARYTVAARSGTDELAVDLPEAVLRDEGVLGAAAAGGDAVRRGRLDAGVPVELAGGGEPGQAQVLAMPLRRGGRTVAVLALFGRRDGAPYSVEDEELLRTLAEQAAIAVDNIRLHREAERLSMTDPLTGLRNFRYLTRELAREIERATRFGRPLTVLILDLDHFKSVNDTYGHPRGDSVLRELAARVSEQIREVDTFARYGGEEFVIVLPETGPAGACQLAERIGNAVRRRRFGGPGEEPLRVTVSIGVAAFPEHARSAATLMRAADEALYVAKRSGRDRWQLAETDEDNG
jgi:two-component system cell cycle response regulator